MIGPLSVLAACLLPVAGALGVHDLRTGLIAVAAQLICLGWLTTEVRRLPIRLLAGVLAALSIGITTWLWAGRELDSAGTAALRVLALTLPTALLAPRLRTDTLGDHLGQRLRLPARAAVGVASGFARIELIAASWQQVLTARRARGRGLGGGPIARGRELAASGFAVLVLSMRDAGQLTVAMDARGFAGAHARTWAEEAPWTWADWVVVALGLVVAVVPWVA